MKKAINQGTTLFVVSGTSMKDAKFNLLYVNKKTTQNVEEEHFYSKSVGTKQVVQTKEDIEKLDGMPKLIAMSGGLNRTLHVIEQGTKKVMKLHTIIYDRNNKKYDIDIIDKKFSKYFRSRKSAKKYYRKLMSKSGLVIVDEYGAFLHQSA